MYIIDHAWFSRPGPRLLEGVELLAHILHPSRVAAPADVADAEVLKMSLPEGQRCSPKQLYACFIPMFGEGRGEGEGEGERGRERKGEREREREGRGIEAMNVGREGGVAGNGEPRTP